MIFEIENIPIYFPYKQIYPEQLRYIHSLLKSLQSSGHCLIEMPSGTGKTIALLSCTVSYVLHCRTVQKPYKIVYCSRTVPEIDKALKELKKLITYIKDEKGDFPFLGLGLSKRSNLCVNESALNSFDVDIACRRLTRKLNNLKCDFYENKEYSVPSGVYDFSDLITLGKEQGICPYYFVRDNITKCDCIIYTYNYMIDPAIFSIISRELPRDSFVIFDEAHNIDSHCIEALSLNLERSHLEGATKALSIIEKKIKTAKKDAARDLEKEYALMKKKIDFITEDTVPYFYESKTHEFAPGNLRNSSHFLSVMKRLIEFFKTKLKTTHLTAETISSFTTSIQDLTFVDKKTMQFCSQRLGILMQTLNIEDDEMGDLKKIANFATFLSIYSKGFSVIFEPYDSMAAVFDPILRLSCLDASIAMAHIFSTFRNVILTSGTLSPIEMYPKILNFVPVNIVEIGATLDRNSISPLIITKGNDQMLLKSEDDTNDANKMTTSFTLRINPSIVRNYGNLIINLSKTVPDNIVVFFPSYIYMEEIITIWSESGIIKDILQNKLVFIETPDFRETEIALKNYRLACDNGRGAILFSVARGKVSEGVDFEHGYGRAVVMLGVPFMFTESVRLKERLRYLKTEFNIKEYDFLIFDAMKHAAQCLGRVLRNKTDYGLMIMADQRFSMPNKISKMPKWIQERIEKGNTGLSIDMAISIAKCFYREMAQDVNGLGNSLLVEDDINPFISKLKS